MPTVFVIPVRNPEELREALIMDLQRRLSRLDFEETRLTRRKIDQRAIQRAKMELEEVLSFWQEVELRGKRGTPTS